MWRTGVATRAAHPMISETTSAGELHEKMIFCSGFWAVYFLVLQVIELVASARNITKQPRHRHRERINNKTHLVHTSSGVVEGMIVKVSKNEKVWAFLGIPYAEPPIGPLRFQVRWLQPPEIFWICKTNSLSALQVDAGTFFTIGGDAMKYALWFVGNLMQKVDR